ncbi:MAG: phosphatase PAP2 family protein, partial [Verrucomicrobia bacterium]|nr:phosphatase PAP2 family protein [Verrucomicrobiota bacterium]
MDWLQTLDAELFRFFNLKLINPVCDVLMPFVSGNALFRPLLLLAGILMIWKGRARGVLCLLMLALILPLGDGLICNNIKHAVGRPRPFVVLPEVHRPGRNPDSVSMTPLLAPKNGKAAPPSDARGDYASMPSSHTANWFAATMILLIYYRRSVRFMLPGAILVGFSRIYNGVHYPGDVLVGAILGAGYAAASGWSLNALWQWAGQRWFPLWWQKVPSLLNPPQRGDAEETEEPQFAPRPSPLARALPASAPEAPQTSAIAAESGKPASKASVTNTPTHSALTAKSLTPHSTLDQHWLRLGYIFIG